MTKSVTSTSHQGHCEECLAYDILLDNNLISSKAFVSDRPDIIDGDRGIEVTLVKAYLSDTEIDPIPGQLHFGLLPKENQYVHMEDYWCETCKYLPSCQEDFQWFPVKCARCETKTRWLKEGYLISPKGTAYYAGRIHPCATSHSEPVDDTLDRLEKTIRNKEDKAKGYSKINLDLFLFDDREVEKLKIPPSSKFNNLYIYCLDSGNFYVNGNLQQVYNRIFNRECHNKNCVNFGKFHQ